MANGNNNLKPWSKASSTQRSKWVKTWKKHSEMREGAKGGNGKSKAGKPIGLGVYLKTHGYKRDKPMPEESLYGMTKKKKY